MTVQLPEDRTRTEALDRFVDDLIAQAQDQRYAQDLARWQEDLQARLQRVQQHPEPNLGFIEGHIRQASLQLQRLLVRQAMQAKADAVAEACPDCHSPLGAKKRRVPKNVDAYCGPVKVLRTHGWGARCAHWVFPADRALGLRADSTASPLVQERCSSPRCPPSKPKRWRRASSAAP